MKLTTALLLLLVLGGCHTSPDPRPLATFGKPHCKCLPQDACWPTASDWSAFNETVHGRLLALAPPASVCYPGAHYNATRCTAARTGWHTMPWRTGHPAAMAAYQWEELGEQTCRLDNAGTRECRQGNVPSYAVRAETPQDVQAAVRFAAERNLRLVVKNTGHDYAGRSTAAGALSVWTHNMKQITLVDSFVVAGCGSKKTAVPAVTVAAGVQWGEVYRVVLAANRLVVGGSCPTVGASGGYVLGGGHSVLTPRFGLAVDNVLQMTVVTATGEHVIVSECQHTDLFWALRGGGGGFGVVTSTTYKTHEQQSGAVVSLHAAATSPAAFRHYIGKFMAMHPQLNAHQFSGEYVISGLTLSAPLLLTTHRDVAQVQSLMMPLSSPGLADVTVQLSIEPVNDLLSFYARFIAKGEADIFASRIVIGSRLIPQYTLEHSPMQVTDAVLSAHPHPSNASTVTGYFATPAHTILLAEPSAALPAWRTASAHLVYSMILRDNATLLEQRAGEQAVTSVIERWKAVTPGSGSYVNDADPNERDWQVNKYGANYQRLQAIKRQVDPAGLFVCRHCVDSEQWTDDGNCHRPSRFTIQH
ncbi:hypothetical protein RI367_002395 [Sorochytrium milnesiophthora]